RVRSDAAAGADDGVFDMRKRSDEGTRPDADVPHHAMRADNDVFGKQYLSFEDAADIDAYVAAAGQTAANVDARGVGQRHARVEQHAGLRALVEPLELRQIALAVDAERFHQVFRARRRHYGALRYCESNDIGKIILAARVLVVY